MRYRAGVQWILPELGIPSRRHNYTYGIWDSERTAYVIARIMAVIHDYLICLDRDWGIQWYVERIETSKGGTP